MSSLALFPGLIPSLSINVIFVEIWCYQIQCALLFLVHRIQQLNMGGAFTGTPKQRVIEQPQPQPQQKMPSKSSEM